MMYKTFNNLAPTYLTELFTPTSNIHGRGIRSIENETLRVSFARTKYYEYSFTVSGAKQWNLLPLELRQTNTLSSFKKKLKTFLLAQYDVASLSLSYLEKHGIRPNNIRH